MDATDFLKMATGGWPALENAATNAKADMERQRATMQARAAELAAPFLSPAGKLALEILIKATLLRPLVKPAEGYSLEQQAMYAMRREGQNEIVQTILNAVAAVEGDETQSERGMQ